MSSPGAIVGGIVGGIVGFFAGGNVIMGAELGMAIGGALDPPKQPATYGPRLTDLTQQTSTYGVAIPRAYGTIPTMGNVFWIEGNKLKETPKTDSGKKGSTSTTTYSYSTTFAVSICDGPISAISQIWLGPKLIFDISPTASIATRAASLLMQSKGAFTFYNGSDTQQPDPRMQADVGVANCPAYRGLAYIVFNDLQLQDYGNSLMGCPARIVFSAQDSTFKAIEAMGVPSVSTGDVSDFVTTKDGRYAYCTDIGVGIYQYGIINQELYPLAVPVVANPNLTAHMAVDPSGVLLYVTTVLGISVYSIDSGAAPGFPGESVSGGGLTLLSTYASGGIYIFGKLEISPDGKLLFANVRGTSVSTFLPGNNLTFLSNTVYPAGTSLIDIKVSPNSSFLYAVDQHLKVIYQSKILGGFSALSPLVPASVVCSNPGFLELHPAGSWAYFADQGNGGISEFSVAAGGQLTYVDRAGYPMPHVYRVKISPDGFQLYALGYTFSQSFIAVFNFSNGDAGGTLSQTQQVLTPTAYYPQISHDGSAIYIAGGSKIYQYFLTETINTTLVSLSSIVEAECLKSDLLTASDIDATLLTDTVRGYRVSNIAAIRGNLDALQKAFPFDVIQHGYKLQAVPRGKTSIATINWMELDAHQAAGQSGVQLTIDREMDIILPAKVVLSHFDILREYNMGEQYAMRTYDFTDSVNVSPIQLPICMTPSECLSVAKKLLYVYWLERSTLSFTLDQTYNFLEPTDVVTIITDNSTYEIRISDISYQSDGTIKCSGKLNASSIYTQTAVAETTQYASQSVALAGITVPALLNIPSLSDVSDAPGIFVSLYGKTTAWSGGVLYSSADAGATWAPIYSGPATIEPVVGYAKNSLNTRTPIDCGLKDSSTELAVTILSSPNSTLSSITEIEMLNGGNHMAYGAEGRWEIVGFQNAVLQIDGTYILSDFLRGRFGTEWATGLHQANDMLVLLGSTTIDFLAQSSSTIGLSREYAAVTDGDLFANSTPGNFTYTGVNLKPLAPAYATGNNSGVGDWAISWTRRTRNGGELRDLVDVPLDEVAESYEIDIYTDATFTTVKRTLAASLNNLVYTSAQQVTDFGIAQSSIYARIYQISATVGRGYPLQHTFN